MKRGITNLATRATKLLIMLGSCTKNATSTTGNGGLPKDDGGVEILPMPDKYRKEMLADWRGAGRAQGYGDNTNEWYKVNRNKMQLHPETRAWIEYQLYGGELDVES